MKTIVSALPWAALMMLALVSVPRSAQPQPGERHPHIRSAMNELREARDELKNAAHDFCGHRVQALDDCDRALHQLRLALECPAAK